MFSTAGDARRIQMRDVVIISACRTPVGDFNGALKTTPAPKLGAVVIREALRRARVDPGQVDELIFGCVLPHNLGQNPARQACFAAELPHQVECLTINKVCGSGLKAVMLAAQAIACGDAEIVVAGGMENMNLCPYMLAKARSGYRMGTGEVIDAMVHDGLWDLLNDFHMGYTRHGQVRVLFVPKGPQGPGRRKVQGGDRTGRDPPA
jgi:acetyl-CoA C-acetyltransferase